MCALVTKFCVGGVAFDMTLQQSGCRIKQCMSELTCGMKCVEGFVGSKKAEACFKESHAWKHVCEFAAIRHWQCTVGCFWCPIKLLVWILDCPRWILPLRMLAYRAYGVIGVQEIRTQARLDKAPNMWTHALRRSPPPNAMCRDFIRAEKVLRYVLELFCKHSMSSMTASPAFVATDSGTPLQDCR